MFGFILRVPATSLALQKYYY